MSAGSGPSKDASRLSWTPLVDSSGSVQCCVTLGFVFFLRSRPHLVEIMVEVLLGCQTPIPFFIVLVGPWPLCQNILSIESTPAVEDWCAILGSIGRRSWSVAQSADSWKLRVAVRSASSSFRWVPAQGEYVLPLYD
ncbi:unnamed protein product [Mycena citricolor]|uniref:Uncharacterized protein n=1 Tax=Mycena citricolor TaxID=2018698 RepID=A0AAD2H6A6_9AGAR|nr:unnamed protein product [Mycena citricolor]